MILVILSLAGIGFFLSFVLMQPSRTRAILSAVLALLIILSIAGIAANDLHHYGFREAQTSETKRLGTIQNQPVVGRMAIGKNEAFVYRYQTADQDKPQVVKPSLTTTTKLVRGNQAQIKTTTTRSQYRNNWSEFLFWGSGQDGQLVSRTVTLTVPNSWKIVDVKK
ncbi:DUF4811 domain-containing protein [Lacticaseibacillus saniviri]